MRLNVNPNRMELSRLKARLITAKRGHKLLKDKNDELIRRFIGLIKLNDSLRKSVEAELASVYKDFVMVGALMSPEVLSQAVMFPKEEMSLELSAGNIMSVAVPQIKFVGKLEESGVEGGIFPYGFAGTSDELDRALTKLHSILPELLQLGEVEKTC